MIVFMTQRYLAGIFSDPKRAADYLEKKPADVECQQFTINNKFPIYLIEFVPGGFGFFTDEAEARAQPQAAALYFLTEDFEPEWPWTDQMGAVEHTHLMDEEHEGADDS